MLSTAIGIGVPFGAPQSPLLQLTALIRSLGGSLYVPGISTFENAGSTTITGTLDNSAEVDDVIAYTGDLCRYNDPENMLINSVFAGASAGVAPTGWTVAGTVAGITTTIVSASTSRITLRVSGTATGTSNTPLLRRTTGMETIAKPGEMWSAQAKVDVVSGSLPESKLRVQLLETGSGDSGLSSVSSYFLASDTKATTKVFADANVIRAKMYVTFDYTNGETYDFTITISNVQLERGRPRTYVPTTTTAISRGVFNPAFQATTSYKPLLKQTNGKMNLLFNGTNQFFQTSINPTSSGYLIVVARQDEAVGGTNTLIGAYKNSATIQAGVSLRVSNTGTITLVRVAADGTANSAHTTTLITPGVAFVADCEWTAAGATARLNGAGAAPSSTAKDAANVSNALTIGALNQGTAAAPSMIDYLQGATFLVGFIPSVPTAAEMSRIRKLAAQLTGVTGVV